jgi:hypothetical protein
VVLAGGSIAALLADVYGVAAMATVFWFVSVPSMILLTVLATTARVSAELRERIRVGTVAGVLGTLAYDLVRIPFALAGQRAFAPIDSYGVLIADAFASSGLTSALGWLYHLSNGVCFAIAYAAVMARRRWPWGIAWALILETVAVLSPFGARYGLSGQALPIAIAYGAHLFYGYPVGRLVQDLDTVSQTLNRLGRHSVAVVLGVPVVLVVGWLRPWSALTAELESGTHPSMDLPTAVVMSDRFEPEWLRIHTGGCVVVENRSSTSFDTPYGSVRPDTSSRLCFDEAGAHRVRLGPRPFSGGFVYVEAKR